MDELVGVFRYPPLPDPGHCIRILHLAPSNSVGSTLRGRLVNTDLSTHPQYHAVSYLWGDVTASPTDYCELSSPDSIQSPEGEAYSRLPVLKNCGAALRHLRWKNQERPLWVDAICIDQANLAERSRQVRIMEFIYQTATKVVIWLDLRGVSTSESKELMRAVRLWSWLFRVGCIQSPRLSEDWHRSRIEKVIEKLTGYDRSKTWRQLVEILQQPYFLRSWTVQEVVGTSLWNVEIVSPAGNIRWAQILTFVHLHTAGSLGRFSEDLRVHRSLSCRGFWIHDSSVLIHSLKMRLSDSQVRLADLWRTETPSYPYENIPSLEASDPRDKAYAFLWTLPRSRGENLDIFDIDYTKTIETVFTEFTIAVAYETGDLAMLLTMASLPEKMSSVPSWVPDWATAPSPFQWNFIRRIVGRPTSIGDVAISKESHQRGHWVLPERITFQGAAMDVRGRRETDRITVSLPILGLQMSSNTAFLILDLEVMISCCPAIYFGILVTSLCVVFARLRDDHDLAMLAELSGLSRDYRMRWAIEQGTVRVPPHVPDALEFMLIRGIINAYAMAYTAPATVPEISNEMLLASCLCVHLEDYLSEELLTELVLALEPNGDLRQERIDYTALDLTGTRKHFLQALLDWLRTFNVDLSRHLGYFITGCMGSQLFKTESGKVGLALGKVEAGDELALWEGVACPVVIRRSRDNATLDDRPERQGCRLVSTAIVAGMEPGGEDWEDDCLIVYRVD